MAKIELVINMNTDNINQTECSVGNNGSPTQRVDSSLTQPMQSRKSTLSRLSKRNDICEGQIWLDHHPKRKNRFIVVLDVGDAKIQCRCLNEDRSSFVRREQFNRGKTGFFRAKDFPLEITRSIKDGMLTVAEADRLITKYYGSSL